MEVYAHAEKILKQYCNKFSTWFRMTRVLVQDDTGAGFRATHSHEPGMVQDVSSCRYRCRCHCHFRRAQSQSWMVF